MFPQHLARQADASQLAHSIDISPWHATTGAPEQRLCARIYKLADPGGSPQSGPAGTRCIVLPVAGALLGSSASRARADAAELQSGLVQPAGIEPHPLTSAAGRSVPINGARLPA